MRPTLAILLSAIVVTATAHHLGASENWNAWPRLVASVERIRPLVESARFASKATERDLADLERIETIDTALDERASTDDGIGAPWMWKPEHREALVTLVTDVRPLLDELSKIAEQRRGLSPMFCKPSMRSTRHRTNLFCAAALVEGDDLRARTLFEQAWEVATLEDDGGSLALYMQKMDAAIIAEAIRRRADQRGYRDDVLSESMHVAFATVLTCREELERSGRDLVQFVDQPKRGEVELWVLQQQRRISEELFPALVGTVALDDFYARADGHGLWFIGLFMCSPASAAAWGKQLSL